MVSTCAVRNSAAYPGPSWIAVAFVESYTVSMAFNEIIVGTTFLIKSVLKCELLERNKTFKEQCHETGACSVPLRNFENTESISYP